MMMAIISILRSAMASRERNILERSFHTFKKNTKKMSDKL